MVVPYAAMIGGVVVGVVAVGFMIYFLFQQDKEKSFSYEDLSSARNCPPVPNDSCDKCNRPISVTQEKLRGKRFSCGHTFHVKCLENNSCPTCNKRKVV